MSLGPAGVSLNPEQADNFEDVRNQAMRPDPILTVEIEDGKAVRRERFAVFVPLVPDRS